MRIAIVANYSWIGISSPLINCITNLLERDIEVSLFCDRPDFRRFPLSYSILNNKNFNLISITGLGRGFLGDIYYFIVNYRKFKKYNFTYAFDHQSVLRAYFISKINKCPLIYFNLEFFIPDSFLGKLYKSRERFVSSKAKLIITQDLIRANWLKENLHQDLNKFRILYNSPRKVSNFTEKNNFFHKKYNIPEDCHIVLITGSLIPEHLIMEAVISSLSWKSNIVLILHGWFADKIFKQKILDLSIKYPKKFFISEDLLNEDDKLLPYLSCDIGFIGYTHTSINHSLVGCASGKFFEFIKVGKPILLIESESLSDIVSKFDIGRVVFDFNQVDKKIDQILNNYDRLSKNSFKCFSSYEFDKNFDSILKSIEE